MNGRPFIDDEFATIHGRLQYEPRAVGRQLAIDDPDKEHWVYESPPIPRRPRIRIYYTITGKVVSIEAISPA